MDPVGPVLPSIVEQIPQRCGSFAIREGRTPGAPDHRSPRLARGGDAATGKLSTDAIRAVAVGLDRVSAHHGTRSVRPWPAVHGRRPRCGRGDASNETEFTPRAGETTGLVPELPTAIEESRLSMDRSPRSVRISIPRIGPYSGCWSHGGGLRTELVTGARARRGVTISQLLPPARRP